METTNKKYNIDNFYDELIHQKASQNIIENLEVWKIFYQNRYTIIKENITDERLYEIIQFLLKYENGQIAPYFQSDILDILNREQQLLIYSLRESNHPNNINILLQQQDNYEKMVNFLKQQPRKDDFLTKNSTEKYFTNNLKIDIIEALIRNLYNNFFHFSPNLVNKAIEYIEKNISQTIQYNPNLRKTNNLTEENLIYQYLKYLIPIKLFIGKEIKEDPLIQKILDGKIQSQKAINKLFNNLNLDLILYILNDNIKEFQKFIHRLDQLDEVYKQTIFEIFLDNLIKEKKVEYIMPLIIENSSDKYWNRYINKKLLEKIFNNIMGSSPDELNFSIINYLLDKKYFNELFLINLKEFLKNQNNSLTEEQYQILSEKLNNEILSEKLNNQKYQAQNIFQQDELNFEQAIHLLDRYLSKKITLDKITMMNIIKSIIKNILKELEIENTAVYFVKYKNYYGEFDPNDQEETKLPQHININMILIEKILNQKLPLSERIQILVTMLHEIRHAIQKKKKNNIIEEIEIYEMRKESILRDYDIDYYTKNYIQVKEEIDARIESYNMLAKFLEQFLPAHLDKIQDSIIASLEKEQTIRNEREEKELLEVIQKQNINFHLSFDLLIRYNPKIQKENPIFNLEYNPDGTPKSLEELIITKQQNEKMSKLIDEIIKKRYQPQNLEPKRSNFKK